MRLLFYSTILLVAFQLQLNAQDTFSICAVDTVTGEVGSAGASCIDANSIAGGAVIISDVHPGVGVIHTQSYWNQANQIYAGQLMNLGYSPQQILDTVTFYDAQGSPSLRQYGAVDLNGGSARSAAFTGANCMNYKNHIIGPNYAIQGNILLGQQILDSMEARFLAEPGDLACKLMAALQGANVPGADTRCLASGNSSLSSFIKVYRPDSSVVVDIVVAIGPVGYEPIDSLQTRFNAVHVCSTNNVSAHSPAIRLNVFPNPANQQVAFQLQNTDQLSCTVQLYNALGVLMREENFANTQSTPLTLDRKELAAGFYLMYVRMPNGQQAYATIVFAD